MIDRKDLRDWMFRGLLFEAEAERFRSAGIRVGANEAESERELFEEMLDPFGIDLRNEALRMARLFALIYCFENSVRRLLAERLREHHGADWWNQKVPKKIKDFAEARQKDARRSGGLKSLRELAYSEGFTPSQLRRLRELVSEHSGLFARAWDEYFHRA